MLEAECRVGITGSLDDAACVVDSDLITVAERTALAQRSTWLALTHVLGVGGIAAFVAAVVALHGLRADLNPSEHTISEYSLGNYGWLMRAAFGAFGLGVLATAVSLRLIFERSIWRGVGLMLLVATAAGLFLDAGYNTDRLGVAETFDGAIHGDGMFILCLTLPAVACVLGSCFVRCGTTVRAKVLLALGPTDLMAILAFEISPTGYRGLTERIAIGLGVLICTLVQSLLHAAAKEPITQRTRALRWPRSVSGLGSRRLIGHFRGGSARDRAMFR
jgi:hypothetical protein